MGWHSSPQCTELMPPMDDFSNSLLDPGGVLRTCRTATRTAACRRLQTIGFCRATAAAILLSTTLHIAGLNDAACLLAPSSFVRPLLGWHVEFAPDRLARLWSGGT